MQGLVLNPTSTPKLIKLEKILSLELTDLMIVEEFFFKQKSRISWIQEGDQNTRFFQKAVADQHHKSLIRSLTNDDGEVLSSFSQISTKAVSFFQRLIGTIDPQVQGCSK